MKTPFQKLPLMLGIFLLCAHPAWAEVMDKEPALSQIWLMVVIAAAAGLVICRWKPLWGVVSFMVISCYLFSIVSQWADPNIGPLIRHEAGYFWQLCLAFVAVIFFHVWGVVFYRRRHRQQSTV